MLRGGLLCKTGFKREINQDRAGVLIEKEEGLCYVADGMGGHYAGHLASGIISEMLTSWWKDHIHAQDTCPTAETADQLKEVLRKSAAAIQAQTPEGQYSGSTIVLLWITGERYLLVSAGDSRCYRVRPLGIGYEMRQLGTDDVYHSQNSEDAQMDGKLTNAVDSENNVVCSVQTGKMEKNTLFALCSDGVYRFCDAVLFSKTLIHTARDGEIKNALRQIDGQVCANGAPDNYSLVLVRYE